MEVVNIMIRHISKPQNHWYCPSSDSSLYTTTNGVVERKYRILTEIVNPMLSNSGLGHGLWGEALLTAGYT